MIDILYGSYEYYILLAFFQSQNKGTIEPRKKDSVGKYCIQLSPHLFDKAFDYLVEKNVFEKTSETTNDLWTSYRYVGKTSTVRFSGPVFDTIVDIFLMEDEENELDTLLLNKSEFVLSFSESLRTRGLSLGGEAEEDLILRILVETGQIYVEDNDGTDPDLADYQDGIDNRILYGWDVEDKYAMM